MSKNEIDETLLGKFDARQVFCGTFWDACMRDHICSGGCENVVFNKFVQREIDPVILDTSIDDCLY